MGTATPGTCSAQPNQRECDDRHSPETSLTVNIEAAKRRKNAAHGVSRV
jgi:hypothetical protein